MNESKPAGGSETGLDPKVSSLLAYLLWIVGGIVFYAISKDSYVRFHAMQSILFSVVFIAIDIVLGILGVFSSIFGFGFGISSLVSLVFFIFWIILMMKAYQGERYKLPILGDLAEKYSNK